MRRANPFLQALHAWADISTQHSWRSWVHQARASSLSVPQFRILMQIYRRGFCGISDISDGFEISSAAASQHVENLVQAGLIGRTEDPHDRRAKQIQLSDKGRALIQHGLGVRYQWVDQLAKQIDPKDYDKVAEALTILAEAAHKIEQAQ